MANLLKHRLLGSHTGDLECGPSDADVAGASAPL